MNRYLAAYACVLLAFASAATAATTTQLSQFGITWTFAEPVEYGQFANGDYWVVGPVDIVDIDPASVDAGGYIINGSMINPVPESQQQGFDSRNCVSYTPSLNVAFGVSPAAPLTVPPHSSLLSSISLPAPEGAVTIDTVAILTVLSEPAVEGSFRPAYCPADKTIRYHVSQLDYSLLRELAPQGNPPALSTVERMFERPWIEFVANYTSRCIHPKQNMRDYGRDISAEVSQAALSLHLDYTNTQKETLLIRFVQVGIDFYGVVEAGGDNVWVANGGHMHGRKWPILFAGLMLGDPAMQHVKAAFQEDQQTYYGVGWTGATALWRITPGTAYLQDEVHPSEWLVDGRGEPGDPPAGSNSHARSEAYRHCCSSYTWIGQALAAYLMDAEALWGHSPFFAYVERWMTEDYTPFLAIIEQETGRTYPNQGSANPGWSGDMWRAYRSLVGPIPPTADAGEDIIVRDNDSDGVEPVTLDGSGSVAAGSIVAYVWSIGGVQIATGVAPTVALAVGEHTIELTVTADNGTTHTDSMTVIVEPAPAGGGAVIFDLSGAYNYDAVSTQAEADNRNAGENIFQSYGDHQPWVSNRNFCKSELGRGGMPEDGRVATTYADYVLGAYDEPTPTPGSNAPNSIFLFRGAGGSTPGAVTLDIDLAADDRAQYATVNMLVSGTSSDTSAEEAKFTLEARYQDGTHEVIYVSGLNSAGNQTGLPSPTSSGLGLQSAWAMTHWCQNNSGGQVLFSTIGGGATANLWELGGDDGLPVDPDRTLVGFTMSLERVGPYPYGSKAVIYSIVGKPPQETAIPGDANRDGVVDLDDFVILKNNFGTIGGATWEMGDFNGDGNVDLDDFVILKQNFGR